MRSIASLLTLLFDENLSVDYTSQLLVRESTTRKVATRFVCQDALVGIWDSLSKERRFTIQCFVANNAKRPEINAFRDVHML
jgi:hypothetical protein